MFNPLLTLANLKFIFYLCLHIVFTVRASVPYLFNKRSYSLKIIFRADFLERTNIIRPLNAEVVMLFY